VFVKTKRILIPKSTAPQENHPDYYTTYFIEGGFLENIRQLVNAIQSTTKLRVDFIHCGFENSELNSEDSLAIYSIILEQLSYVVHYAGALQATVHLAKNNSQVAIVIESDGVGFKMKDINWKHTIKTIQEKVDSYRGKLVLQCKDGKGVLLQIFMDLNTTAAE
jgi:signal transduction histidine kinase